MSASNFAANKVKTGQNDTGSFRDLWYGFASPGVVSLVMAPVGALITLLLILEPCGKKKH